VLISSTEPPQLRALGRSSLVPEQYGADILWLSRLGLVGVQRKEMPGDFLASVSDGRLANQVGRMQGLDVRVLVLEGRPQWTTDGVLMADWGQTWTRSQHRKFLWSMRREGVWVEWSDQLMDTVELVKDLLAWTNKKNHVSLQRRPAARGAWGKASNREWQLHLLQSFDGIGPMQAGKLIDAFDGDVPLAWTVEGRELERVPGIGKKKAQKMVEAIGVIRDVGGEVVKNGKGVVA
jgi:ERCC4-type nuclease